MKLICAFINANFINSEGWNENPKILIHLEAPFASNPIIGKKTNVSKKKENNIKTMSIDFHISKENLKTNKPTTTDKASLRI